MSKKTNTDMWIICPECKNKLKKENLETHLKHVHDKKIEDVDESSIKVLSKKVQKQKKAKSFSMVNIIVIIVVIVAICGVAYFVLSGNLGLNNNSSNSNSDNPAWLDDYTPVHLIGTGSDNFWIDFPSGNSVQHKTWVIEGLEEKPVFFVCHRTGCASCTPQADRVKVLGEKYAKYAIFYDLDDDYAGTATADILKKYNEGFYYDPNGGSHYIALTGVFTLVNDGGEIKIGWHSWEAPNDRTISDSALETWIKDAIYYYHINSGA